MRRWSEGHSIRWLQRLLGPALLLAAAPALAQNEAGSPLDPTEARMLVEEPDSRLSGTVEQQDAARAVMRALPPGTLIRTRGGLAFENRSLRILNGQVMTGEQLAGQHVPQPCAIGWPADYLEFPASYRTTNPDVWAEWTVTAWTIVRVRQEARSTLVIEQPFNAGGGFLFLTFPEDADATRALTAFAAWASACRAGEDHWGTAQRLEARLTEAILAESDLGRGDHAPSRRVTGLFSEFDRIACGQPLQIYTVAMRSGVGSPLYERADEHRPISLDRLRRVSIQTDPFWGQVTIQPLEGPRLTFRFVGGAAAEEATALADDLRLFGTQCRAFEQRQERERAEASVRQTGFQR